MQKAHDLRLRDTAISETPFSAATFRDEQVKIADHPNMYDTTGHYGVLLKQEIGTQTDFEASVFYDS